MDLTELRDHLARLRGEWWSTGLRQRRPLSGEVYERACQVESALQSADAHLIHLQAALNSEDERDVLRARLAELDRDLA